MRRQNPAFVVHQGDLGPLDLPWTETAPELAHGLHDPEKAAGGAGMRMRQHAAVGVDGQLAADAGMPLGEE